jgi:hypothetical protein
MYIRSGSAEQVGLESCFSGVNGDGDSSPCGDSKDSKGKSGLSLWIFMKRRKSGFNSFAKLSAISSTEASFPEDLILFHNCSIRELVEVSALFKLSNREKTRNRISLLGKTCSDISHNITKMSDQKSLLMLKPNS